jgi:hypothetical protein
MTSVTVLPGTWWTSSNATTQKLRACSTNSTSVRNPAICFLTESFSQNDYDILVESSLAEAQSNLADSKNKLTFLGGYKGDQTINQKVLFETQATIAGVDDDTIKRLLDTNDYDAIEVIAQADEAFQLIIGGDKAPLFEDLT